MHESNQTFNQNFELKAKSKNLVYQVKKSCHRKIILILELLTPLGNFCQH